MELETVEDILPLTPVQHGILFHTLEAGEEALYFQQVILSLRGSVNRAALKLAATDLLQAHPILRSVILWDGLENPVQVVHREMAVQWQEIDLQLHSAGASNNEIEKYLQSDRKLKFDLTVGPLIRFSAFYINSNESQLVLSFHHILLDGWSVRTLLADMSACYSARCENRTAKLVAAPAYRTYVDWLAAQSSAKALDYWREQLRGVVAPTPLLLPSPASSTQQSENDEWHTEQRFTLAADQVAQLTSAIKRHKVTFNTLALAAWALVMARYSGTDKVLFGTSLAGRPHDLSQVEAMVGMFIQTIPVLVPVQNDVSISSWLNAIASNQLRASENAHCGLSEIGKCSELPPGSEMFESLVVFENLGSQNHTGDRFANLALEKTDFLERSNYPLAILVVPSTTWELIAIHDTRRFTAQHTHQLLTHLATTIMQLANSTPSTLLGAIDCLQPIERDRILSYGRGASHVNQRQSWLSLFTETVENNAEKVALCSGETTWTYAELAKQVNSLAQRYRSAGLCSGDLVGVVAHRTPDTLAAVIAVLLAGGVYVPLEPDQPVARLALITDNAGLKWQVGELAQCELVIPRLDDNSLTVDDAQTNSVSETKFKGDEPAYVIHTSGSTGTPRGVVVSHSNLLHSTTARPAYYKQNPESFLLLSSLAFDSSVAGIFWTLGTGGKLVLPEPQGRDDVEHLLRLAQKHSVTHLLCIPSLYELLLDRADGRLNSLRCAIVAGEVCAPRLAQAHRLTLPAASLFNEYGPSEATVWASVADITKHSSNSAVPIGEPIPGVQLYVVDSNDGLCPMGVVGELCIAGPTVALGYLHDSAGTSDRFVADPFAASAQRMYRTGDSARWGEDGQLYYIGREDGQLKIRGRRVDVGEIEAALINNEAVREAAVLMRESNTSAEISLQKIEQTLAAMDSEQAQQLLVAVEDSARGESHHQRGQNFEITLQLDPDCLAPPRDNQRRWLIRQLLQEMRDDVAQLSDHAGKFVSGEATFLNDTPDVSGLDLQARDIMEDWQMPVLQAMVDCVCASHGHVLEIGFGRGISADMIQQNGVRAHTIVEANQHCVRRFFEPWRAGYAERDICLIESDWQLADEQLGQFDGVFFHTAARNLEELIETTVGQVTYAQHFFPTAARHLLPGGVFTYLANEIDSLSRSHQRLLLEHFSEFSVRRVDQLQIPEDTRDVWWAQSMVVVAAVK